MVKVDSKFLTVSGKTPRKTHKDGSEEYYCTRNRALDSDVYLVNLRSNLRKEISEFESLI